MNAAATRQRKPPIPITLVTGARGAGKTRLVNRLLGEPAFAGSAVILNETGATAVAGAVVEQAEDGIIALSGGCVCCSVRGELVEALERLLRALDNGRIETLSRVIIETAGSADPIRVLYLIARHPYLSMRFRMDGTVAVASYPEQLAEDAQLRQVAAADAVVLPRAADADVMTARIARLNPSAPILAGDAPGIATTVTGLFDPIDDSGRLAAWLAFDRYPVAGTHAPAPYSAFVLARDAALPSAALWDFLDRLTLEHGEGLVRFRGIIRADEDQPVLVHGIGGLFSVPQSLAEWPDNDRRTRIAVVARGLDRPALEALLDGFTGGAVDTPDRDALLANPLAIPGFRAR